MIRNYQIDRASLFYLRDLATDTTWKNEASQSVPRLSSRRNVPPHTLGGGFIAEGLPAGHERASSCDDGVRAGPLRTPGAALRSSALDHQGRAMTHILDAIRRAACAGRAGESPWRKEAERKFQLGRSRLLLRHSTAAICFAGVLKYHEVQIYVSCRLSVSFAVLEEYADCDAELLHC